MPVFDFPIEQLREYRGTNPKPEDFDAYWARALRELTDTPANPELVSSPDLESRSAECFDLYYDGVRGARIHAKFLRPMQHAGSLPCILHFHGYSAASPDWAELLQWTAEGYCVAAMDCRGQGGLSEDTGGVKGNTLRGHIIRGLDDHEDNLLFRQIFLDTVQLARVARSFDEVDDRRIHTTGGSQGGALALACAALDDGIARTAATFPFLSDYRRVWNMDLGKGAYEELVDYFRRFDPRHEREEEIWTRLGYISVHHLAPRITAETLLVTSLMDQTCPPSTQFAIYNNLDCPKRHVLYPDFGHEPLPGLGTLVHNFLHRDD